jgi:hypothetical protein
MTEEGKREEAFAELYDAELYAIREEIATEQEALEQYLEEYEMFCDDGYYAPTEREAAMLQDALQGWVAERDKLMAAIRRSHDADRHPHSIGEEE